MTPSEFKLKALDPAYKLLPVKMNTREASVMVIAICLQESRLTSRYQIVQGRPGAKGPARGFPQFELGSQRLGGGVWGVFKHKASRPYLEVACRELGVTFWPQAIWENLEHNDVLAAVMARLLLYTDAKPLPKLGDVKGGWDYYIRTWRPGKPHEATWAGLYAKALESVK